MTSERWDIASSNFSFAVMEEDVPKAEERRRSCSRSRKCSKKDKHGGHCDSSKKVNEFWKASPMQWMNEQKKEIQRTKLAAYEERENAEKLKLDALSLKTDAESIKKDAEKSKQETDEEVEKQKALLSEIKKQYEKLRILLDQKSYSRKRRENSATTFENINDYDCSKRYRRREETHNILEYIHGGIDGAIYGAWDFLVATADKDMFDKLISSYKRGMYLQGIFGNAMKKYANSEDAIKRAVSIKYQSFLSRRRYQFICKTQSSVFDSANEVWVPRNAKCLGLDLRLPSLVSEGTVDKFVKCLDIGHVNVIPNCSGVSRTVTGLVYMILDLHLRLPHLRNRLQWFDDNKFHFIFEFADDGAPETSELSMSIGSITSWNFGERVRCREFHYLLHALSVGEKDEVMSAIWQQHTEEMKLLEGNILTISGIQCTIEFQPSADQSWISWANNELNQAATYPSPYANVHKGNMNTIGGSIGFSDKDTWNPPSQEARTKQLSDLNQFRKTLKPDLDAKQKHRRELQFMAENGIRQCGEPRIGFFANRVKPEPVHCEINGWQHLTNLMYKEGLQRNTVSEFVKVLAAPAGGASCTPCEGSSQGILVKSSFLEAAIGERARTVETINDTYKQFNDAMARFAKTRSISQDAEGCGLAFVAAKIKEHFENEKERYNVLSFRLIGAQAISLARYSYRVIDSLAKDDESPQQSIKRLALGQICKALRDAGSLFNKVQVQQSDINSLKETCSLYFNLMSLFFPENVNLTVWTIGYAIPYYAEQLWEKYKIGYGIISLQAKEAKHAAIKFDLALTNRSRETDTVSGKWLQVLRSNYVRSFHLPEHQQAPVQSTSHYESRVPPHVAATARFCNCGRGKQIGDEACTVCVDSQDVVNCAMQGSLTDKVTKILKPVECIQCSTRFADHSSLETHVNTIHNASNGTVSDKLSKKLNPKCMKVNELKEALKKRNLSTGGAKDILVRRLEGALAAEI